MNREINLRSHSPGKEKTGTKRLRGNEGEEEEEETGQSITQECSSRGKKDGERGKKEARTMNNQLGRLCTNGPIPAVDRRKERTKERMEK